MKPALYDASGVKIVPAKRLETLARLEMQAIVDVEIALACLALEFDMGCSHCNRLIHGSTTLDVWTLECDCTVWRYAGNDIEAPLPPPPINKREPLEDDEKREERISREHMALIKAFEGVVVRVLKGAYRLYCLRCKLNGDRNGVTGASSNEENVWLAECHCTRRIFRDEVSASAAQTTH